MAGSELSSFDDKGYAFDNRVYAGKGKEGAESTYDKGNPKDAVKGE